ncbi:MAG: hypothetical protein M3124_09630 [Actinomycetota bacterium]|nr:hypothetical protein [Actinomycetota bacterium]
MNRKWAVLAIAVTAVLAIAPVDAAGKKKKKKKPPPPPPVEQVVEGDIMFIAPFFDTATNERACFSGLHRRLFLAFGESAQGYVGYHFDVDPATIGGTFILEPGGGADLDIVFYTDFGDQTAAGETVTYETRGTDPEQGEIPANMTKVIVCMFSGTEGAFKYTGTGPTTGGTAGTPASGGSPGASPSASPSTASG